MLQDGLYELLYHNEEIPDSASGSLLVALRDGVVLGSDQWGGVLLGRCEFDQRSRRNSVRVQLKIPPGGMLVTDRSPRLDGGLIVIDAVFGPKGQDVTGVVDVAGQPVRIKLKFKGPVPQ